MAGIAELRNLGPASARLLAEIGVATEAELRALGAVAAYARLKFAFPRRVSLVMLYALEGALTRRHWNRLPASTKARLRRAAARVTIGENTRPRR
jgi:DNA transformation protein